MLRIVLKDLLDFVSILLPLKKFGHYFKMDSIITEPTTSTA